MITRSYEENMKTLVKTLFFAMVMILIIPATSHAQAGMVTKEERTTTALKLMHSLVEKTNIERVNRGLSPLKMQEELTRASVAHARDMVKFGYFAHSTPNAATGVEDYEEYAKTEHYAGRAGQNLYHGEPQAAGIVDAWMNSPVHRTNILEPRYNEVGVGFARGRDFYDTYCVQFFGINATTYPVIINNEAYSTNSNVVHLYIYGREKMKQMRFSIDGVTYSEWETFHSERDWTFTRGEGTRTIYVEVTDGDKVYQSSDDIVLTP